MARNFDFHMFDCGCVEAENDGVGDSMPEIPSI